MAIDEYGNVVLYDFGMMGEITQTQRDAITGCIAQKIQKRTPRKAGGFETVEIADDQ